ncbi:MAG: DNA translocase FtsK [Oscillospiraceae bacterium]|nr:DNA translocase FtsK [Oscillospiraceae bacterium]
MAGTDSSKKTKGAKGAAEPKKTEKKKGASGRAGGRNAAEAQLRKSNQLFAVILFAMGILLTLFALFSGPLLWGAVHQVMRGIFGPMSYAVGPVCIAVSLMIALEKSHAEVHLRVWELIVFFIVLCGLTQFFFGYPAGESFFERVIYLYLNGTRLKSGGLLAGLTAWPLMKVLGSAGSLIVHILLLFILVMAVTGTTLIELIDSVRTPVNKLRENYEDNQEVRRVRRETREQLREEERANHESVRAARLEEKKQQAVSNEVQRRQQRFNIDVAMSEEDARAAAEIERKRAAEKAAEAGEKKKSSAQGLEDALGKITGKAVPETAPDDTVQVPVSEKVSAEAPEETVFEEKPGADDPSLDAIIAAFRKKSDAAPTASVASAAPTAPEKTDAPVSEPASRPASETEAVKFSSANPAGVSETISELLDSQPEQADAPEPESPADLPFDLDENSGARIDQAIRDIRNVPLQSEMPQTQAIPEASAEAEPGAQPDVPTEKELPQEEVYRLPPVSLLKLPKNTNNEDVSEELRQNADKLVETLRSFGVSTRIVDITRGPTVTRYELQPSTGVKISKITGLSDDIALNLATAGVRIEAPIPNKPAVGIEVPNRVTDTVTIREIIDSDEFRNAKGALPAGFGRDIAGQITIGDVAAMPHMLIAGTTGSGKSVCVNSIIISLLYRFSPRDLRMIMVDPKMVEMTIYNGIPHLLIPTVTDARKASGALGWAVNEMEKRYLLLAEHNVRDIKGFNRLVEKSSENGEAEQMAEPLEHMPYIVIVIDELADLMMVASKEVEDSIIRIAQKGRAAGIHLIVATQRPSADVVTGLIRSNVPSRIALTVSSQIDSRIIIDQGGAEKLLGHGDMLYSPIGKKPLRVQGCYVSDEEVEDVVGFIKSNLTQAVEYDKRIIADIEQRAAAEEGGKKGKGGDIDSDGDSDPLLMEAVDVILDAGQASTSYLQRRLKVGYARAARLMDELEDRGIVGPQDGSKPRELQITRSQWAEIRDRMENP